ncbi:DUF5594 family protein [Paraburkholderia nemoris]|uniref:DUF5594 family protein n=1 Tax=Paraburkholderia nemoris TaxID=2793076 RepID=UPI00190C338C|nr:MULTISPECIES: DUF5594 family protein [Paraburkholderia]MBK3785028.1 hypothetical protein [Paraburkholderia aspalathi]CAE6830031.1 hypothetical protein R75461_06512 [Paraburkholderia nemoris]
MRPESATRFDDQFAPRIAEAIAACFATTVHTEVLPYGGHGHPTRVRIHATPIEDLRHYAHPLNLYLTWDSDEIERLMGPEGPARFAGYLAALPRKLEAWRHVRELDFISHTQAEPTVLLGGLDFES